MYQLVLSSAELPAIESEARRLLPYRTKEIDEHGKLNGEHWFIAVVREATGIVRRRKAWARRSQ